RVTNICLQTSIPCSSAATGVNVAGCSGSGAAGSLGSCASAGATVRPARIAIVPNRNISSSPVQLPALGRHHHVENLLGDQRLEAFGVALLHADHVGDDTIVLAAFEDKDLRCAR